MISADRTESASAGSTLGFGGAPDEDCGTASRYTVGQSLLSQNRRSGNCWYLRSTKMMPTPYRSTQAFRSAPVNVERFRRSMAALFRRARLPSTMYLSMRNGRPHPRQSRRQRRNLRLRGGHRASGAQFATVTSPIANDNPTAKPYLPSHPMGW